MMAIPCSPVRRRSDAGSQCLFWRRARARPRFTQHGLSHVRVAQIEGVHVDAPLSPVHLLFSLGFPQHVDVPQGKQPESFGVELVRALDPRNQDFRKGALTEIKSPRADLLDQEAECVRVPHAPTIAQLRARVGPRDDIVRPGEQDRISGERNQLDAAARRWCRWCSVACTTVQRVVEVDRREDVADYAFFACKNKSFQLPVPVPAEAGGGDAETTLWHFADWSQQERPALEEPVQFWISSDMGGPSVDDWAFFFAFQRALSNWLELRPRMIREGPGRGLAARFAARDLWFYAARENVVAGGDLPPQWGERKKDAATALSVGTAELKKRYGRCHMPTAKFFDSKNVPDAYWTRLDQKRSRDFHWLFRGEGKYLGRGEGKGSNSGEGDGTQRYHESWYDAWQEQDFTFSTDYVKSWTGIPWHEWTVDFAKKEHWREQLHLVSADSPFEGAGELQSMQGAFER